VTADWWKQDSPAPRDEGRDWLRSEWTPPPAPPEGRPKARPDDDPARPIDPARKRRLALSAASAAMAGAVIFMAMPDDGNATAPQSPTASQGEELPPAGAGSAEAAVSPQGKVAESASSKAVTLVSSPSGTGRVGAVVKVRIHNGTDGRITLLPNLLRGDDHPGIVGEGTLAPGAKVIEPGGTAEGTVEFAFSEQPGQVVLADLNGNIVAVG